MTWLCVNWTLTTWGQFFSFFWTLCRALAPSGHSANAFTSHHKDVLYDNTKSVSMKIKTKCSWKKRVDINSFSPSNCLGRKIDWPKHFLLLNSFMLTPDFLSVCIYPGDDDNSLVLNFEGFKNTVNIFRGLGGFSFCLSGVFFVCGVFLGFG